MDSVFVAGSRALSKLNTLVKERLDNIVARQLVVLVGDANGADKAVQRYLADRNYQHVVVYCMDVCRNNLGNWPVRSLSAESTVRHDRHYYGIKDRAMAKDASCGFMLWDGVSKGTLTNVVNLLHCDKKVVLFSSPKKRFYTMRSTEDLDRTLKAVGVRDVAALLAALEGKRPTTEPLPFAGIRL